MSAGLSGMVRRRPSLSVQDRAKMSPVGFESLVPDVLTIPGAEPNNTASDTITSPRVITTGCAICILP